MNIENLTIGELRAINAIFNQLTGTQASNSPNPVIGKVCIARCYSAGVHIGTVQSVEGENVVLKDSIRLWQWKANDGVALSGLAQTGLEKGKLDTLNPTIYLTGVCELIPVAEKVVSSFYSESKK